MSRTKIDTLKNFKSWIKDIKFKIKSNNIKLRNWHENNMENFKRGWEKFISCGRKPKYIHTFNYEREPTGTIVKAYPVENKL